MLAIRTRRRKAVALATAVVLAGLAAPSLTATSATATPATATTHAATTTASDYDSTYYKDAVGKTGDSLKSSLHTIISDQTKLSYSAVWDALKVTDQDPADSGNVILLYSGISAASP